MTATHTALGIPNFERRADALPRRGFSVTELLVVIGIIVLLIGLLLPAIGAARTAAKRGSTTATMQEFSKACEAFKLDQGRYPGVIPEPVLAANPNIISGTENALLDLMGGYRLLTPQDPTAPPGPVAADYFAFRDGSAPYTGNCNSVEIVFGSSGYSIVIVPSRVGEGPYINGKQWPAYFTPKTEEFSAAEGTQVGEPHPVTNPCAGANAIPGYNIPDLLDSWGQPIIYMRAAGTTGPLAGISGSAPRPQFYPESALPYVQSSKLGEMGEDQNQTPTNPDGSVLTVGTMADAAFKWAQILRAPAFGAPNDPLNGTARGQYALISAGKDGIYFSAWDGLGTSGSPEVDIDDPQVLKDYDDIVQTGGG
jgi:type II secretory pathway pseudopilin PulG